MKDHQHPAQIIISNHPWSKEHRDLVEDFLRPQGMQPSPWTYRGTFDQDRGLLDQKAAYQSDHRNQISRYDGSGPLSWWIKSAVYNFLSPISEVQLPWGTITGVRPLKVVRRSLKAGRAQELEDFYCMAPEKISLSKEVIHAQEPTLDKCSDQSFSLYLHIPFCPSRCSYCSFPSLTNPSAQEMEDYVGVLIQELKAYAPHLQERYLNSIYIGGGTPTQLASGQLDRLLESIHLHYGPSPELTVEAGRPDTISNEKLEILKKQGVTRISVNPQSFSDQTLQSIGRYHSVQDIIRVSHQVKDMGFDLNMDLILGLPGEGTDEVIKSIAEAIKLNPDNLSIHSLAIKKGSALSSKDVSHLDSGLPYKIQSRLIDQGYIPYYLYRQRQMYPGLENIGYALEDKICHYNVISMEEAETILACGMGAVSKIYRGEKIHQIPNFRSYRDYIDRMEEKLVSKIDSLTS